MDNLNDNRDQKSFVIEIKEGWENDKPPRIFIIKNSNTYCQFNIYFNFKKLFELIDINILEKIGPFSKRVYDKFKKYKE